MGMTMTQKILAKHAGLESVTAGQLIEANVDLTLANDITGPVAIREMEKAGFDKVFDNTKIALVMDHFAPNKDIKSAEQCLECREFSKKYNIVNFFDVGAMGIEHALLPEKGLTAPGELIIGADSHTCTYGALGAFSTGVGSTDLAAGMATGKAWFKVPSAIKFVLKGKLSPWVSGKDVILHIIGKIGVDGALYKSMEFVGEGAHELSMDDRFTICNMAIEAGAKNGIFPVDDKTMDYIKGRVDRNITAFEADADAEYEQTIEIDLSALRPTIACPHLPENTKTIDELGHIEVQQSVIGSCTNGRIDDMRVAAEILKGRKVNPNVRTIIIPATQDVYLQCIEEGPDQDLHSGRRYRFHADLRSVPWRSYGHSGARRKGGLHHQPQFCRPYGSYHLGNLSGKPGSRRSKRSCRLHLCAGRPEVREETHTMNAKGKVFKYGDNVDTDVIIPARYLNIADPKELSTHAMEDIDADFVKNMHPGDIVVATRNFGCGSSREHAPLVLRENGVSCVIASSFARIFYRNAINIGLPILECEAAANGIDAGDEVEVNFDTGVITDVTKGESWQAAAFPPFIQNIIKAGGLLKSLKEREA